MSIEIKAPAIDFKNYKIVSGLPDLLTLYDTHIEKKWNYTADVGNNSDDLLPGKKKYLGETTILKKHIIGVEWGWSLHSERYSIHVYTSAENAEIGMLFETKEEAMKAKKVIEEWLLK